jgi:hypothetical protein
LSYLLIDIMSKHESALETHVADSDASLDGFNGTSEDARDMDRLGRAQELKVCCYVYAMAVATAYFR